MATMKLSNRDNLNAMKLSASFNKLYDEYDWRQAVGTGQADAYLAALTKLNKEDTSNLYNDWNLYFGDKNTKLTAILAEAGADRTNKLPREIISYDEEGNEIKQKVEMSDYDYTKYLVSKSNAYYSKAKMEQFEAEARNNNEGFSAFLAGAVSIPLSFAQGAYQTIDKAIGALGGIAGAMLDPFSNKQNLAKLTTMLDPKTDKATKKKLHDELTDSAFAEFIRGVDIGYSDETAELLTNFQYRYSNMMDENGEYTSWVPAILTGIATTLGQMLPTMGLGPAGQAVFYGANVLIPTMEQDYEYAKSKGMSLSTLSIISKATMKTAAQYGVEWGLGKLLGSTGLNQLIWGEKGSKGLLEIRLANPKANFALQTAINSLQEGLEESLQETSDFFVDTAFNKFVDDNFEEGKWNMEDIALSFVIGALTSVVGDAAKLVGTRRVNTGKIYTNQSGEIVRNEKGEYIFERLGKFESWQFGLDVDSFMDAYSTIVDIEGKINNIKNTDPDADLTTIEQEYIAAFHQATAVYEILTGIYGDVGAEKFTRANNVLKEMTANINEGKFDDSRLEEYRKALDLNMKSISSDYNASVLEKMQKAGMTEIDTVIREGETSSDTESARALEELMNVAGKDGVKKVVLTKDGREAIRNGELLVIPKNLLLNGGVESVYSSAEESNLGNELVRGVVAKEHYFKNEIKIITDLYAQWSGQSEVDVESAIRALIFDTRFFEAVLAVNEKLSSTYVLRLNTLLKSVIKEKGLSKKVLLKKIEECRERWKSAALHFYSNNINSNPDDFVKSLEPEQVAEFKKELNAALQLYNMGSDIILNPKSVDDKVWAFIARRINNMTISEAEKSALIEGVKSEDSKTREKSIMFISDYYEGAFMTLYDGVHYCTKTSIANEMFNAWLEAKGLFIDEIFDREHLTTEELSMLPEDFTQDDIVSLRMREVNTFNENLSIEYNDGVLKIHAKNSEDGFSIVQKVLGKERGAIVTGMSFKLGEDKVSRKIATELKNTNKWIKTLLHPDIVNDNMSDWLTVDDLVNHPEYLSDAIQDIITSEYGRLDRITTYRFIATQLADETGGKQSLVTLQDGSVAIGEMTGMDGLYLEGVNIPKAGLYNLSKFVKAKHLKGILANVTVRIVGPNEIAQYVDYDNRISEDGRSARVFVNEIRIPFSDSQNKMKFTLMHEIQHAFQVENRMNQGIGSKPLQWFEENVRKDIINEVIKMSPELFADLPESSRNSSNAIVVQRVNDYIYYGSGETQAMGLGGTGQLSFYPVRVTRKNGNTVVTFKNGKSFSVKNEVDKKEVSNRLIDNANKVLEKTFSKFNVPQSDKKRLEKMKALANDLGKKAISGENLTQEQYRQLMFYRMGYSGSFEEFLNTDVIVLTINGTRYAVKDAYTAERLLRNSRVDVKNDTASVSISIVKASEVKSYEEVLGVTAGRISVPKTKLRRTREITTDLSVIPEKVMSQDMAKSSNTSRLTGDVLDDEISLKNLIPGYEPFIDELYDNFKVHHNQSFTIKEVLKPFSFNKSLQNSLYDYLYNPIGVETRKGLKEEIMSKITPKDFIMSLAEFQKMFPYFEGEDLLNLELPVVRYQAINEFDNKNDPFVSVYFAINDNTLNNLILNSPNYAYANHTQTGLLIGGKVKLSDCLLIICDSNNVEFLIPQDKISQITCKDFSTGKYGESWTLNKNTLNMVDSKFSEDDTGYYHMSLEYLINLFKTEYDDEYSDTEYYSLLSDKVFNAIKNRDVLRKEHLRNIIGATSTLENTNEFVEGVAIEGINQVWFDLLQGTVPSTILHELIHILTLEATSNANFKLSTSSELENNFDKGGAVLIKVFEQLNTKYNNTPKQTMYYGLKNVDEMVAELANPYFRDFLKQETLYWKTIEGIAQILGEEVVTAESAVVKALDMIMQYYGDYQSVMQQSLDSNDALDYGVYQGLLYRNGERIRSKAFELSGILVLNSQNEDMVKAKNFVSKRLREKGYAVDSLNSLAESIKSCATENPEYFNKIMKALNNSVNAFKHILLNNTFIVLDNKLDNAEISNTVYESYVKQSANNVEEKRAEVVEEIKKEAPTEESEDTSIGAKPKTKTRKPKIPGLEVDNRSDSDKQSSKLFDYNPKIHEYYDTPDIYKKSKPTRIIKKSELDALYEDIESSGKHLSVSRKTSSFLFRDFVERRIYEIGGSEKRVDIYRYYRRKKVSEPRWSTADKLKNTNLQYFKKNKRQITMNPSLMDFVVESTYRKIDSKLMSKIKEGTLKLEDLENYILQSPEEQDLATFQLINEVYFKNSFVNTPQELHQLAIDLGPKMAAMYLVLKDTDFADFITEVNDITEIEKIWNTFSQMPTYSDQLNKIVEGFAYDVNLKKYSRNKAMRGDYSSLDGELLTNLSLYNVMRIFDGTVKSGSAALIDARTKTYRNSLRPGEGYWKVKFGITPTESLESKVGEDKEGRDSTKEKIDTIGEDDDFIKDWTETFKSSIGGEYANNIRKELLSVSGATARYVFKALAAATQDSVKTTNYFANYKESFLGMSTDELYEWYEAFVEHSPEDRLRQIYAMAKMSTEDVNVLENFNDKVQKFVSEIRSNANKAQGVVNKVKTLRKYLAPANYKRFLKENKDIFNEDLTLKQTAYKTVEDGKTVYKTENEVESLSQRISDLILNARNGVYDSDSNFSQYLSNKKATLKAYKDLKATILTETKSTKIKYIPVQFYGPDGEETINVRSDRTIPPVLQKMLSEGLTKRAKTNVLGLSKTHTETDEEGNIKTVYDESHIEITLTQLFDENYWWLTQTSKEAAKEFLDFFLDNAILSTSSEGSIIAFEVQRALAAYFLNCYRKGYEEYDFDSDYMEKVRVRLMGLGTLSGQLLSNEKFIKKMLDPNEQRAQMLAKEIGITLDETDKKNLSDLLLSMRSKDPKKFKTDLNNFENTLIGKYKGNKRTIISKILTLQRAMMLSNPGTWARNIVSNTIVIGGNTASEKTGKTITDLMMKVFPKTKSAFEADSVSYTKTTREGTTVKREVYQYKLDAKVSEDTKNFIDAKFVKSGLFADTINGVSKYNVDLLDHNPAEDNLTDMIARNIAQNIRKDYIFRQGKYAESKTAKFADKTIGLVYKALSDDKFIRNRAMRYLGKILEEEYANAKKSKPDLTFDKFVNTADAKNNRYSISNTATVAYIKAINLASADFMRSPNIISLIEKTFRENAPEGAWFVYKQIFPFLSSSWAWCAEAMRYTPVGLANAIVKLAKLENTVAMFDKKHQEGKSIVNAEFARFLQVRNVGKGALGTSLMFLGMMLAGLGWAGLDEEDDKYKLNVLGVKVNISEVLASQSIMVGIAFIDATQQKLDVLDVLSEVCTQLFRDSILEDFINAGRYSSGVSDFMLDKTESALLMFVPNLFKSISKLANNQGVAYSNNRLIAFLQKLALQMLPLAPAELVGATSKVNIYSGNVESRFGDKFWQTMISQFTPFDMSWPSVNELEAEVRGLDVKRGELTGKYIINDSDKVTLSNEDKLRLNQFYGKLNKKNLNSLFNNTITVRVETENGTYKDLKYKDMNDEQKKNAINNIMSDDASLAKIYILTNTDKYKYYASDSEYNELRKLGITKNVYRKTDKLKGFVKT